MLIGYARAPLSGRGAERYGGRFNAKGTSAASLNVMLWRWTGAGCLLDIVDDENRLTRM